MAFDLPTVRSNLMDLVGNCLNLAKYRWSKAAANLHLRLDPGSFLPACTIVHTAGEFDNKRSSEVCAGL